MWFFAGASVRIRELGVVAEQCPHCGEVTACFAEGVLKGLHLYFIPIAENVTEVRCTCSACGGQFRGEFWKYKEFVPAADAHELPPETLLARTNPSLAERLQWARQQEAFAADPLFVPSLEAAEQLRLGSLRDVLMSGLRRWDELDDRQRERLARTACESARAWKFLGSLTDRLPNFAGCFPALLACLAVWSAFIWAPEVRDMLWGCITVFVGFAVAAAILQAQSGGRVRNWTREVLIPEAEQAGIDFDQLTAVLKDLPPPSPHGQEDSHRWREEAPIVLAELTSAGKSSDLEFEFGGIQS